MACTRKAGCGCAACREFANVSLPPTAQTIDYDAPTPIDPVAAERQAEMDRLRARANAFQFRPDPVEMDADGYTPSFLSSDTAAIAAFFDRYGFVVVRDVLTPDRILGTTEEIFGLAGFKEGPPETLADLEAVEWEETVYGSRYNASKGFVGYDPPDTLHAWQNRLSKEFYEVCAHLFGRKDLVVKIDRFGMMRPTVFPSGEGGGLSSPRKDWQTTGEWIHWDQNPWIEPEFSRIQAVLAVSDHTATSGGFHCVPGFCEQMEEWAEANTLHRSSEELIPVPPDDGMRQYLQKIPMRAGSVVLWDSRTPHGNFPNESQGWRLCQYLGLHPAPTMEHQPGLVKERQDFIRIQLEDGRLPELLGATPLNSRLSGLVPWETEGDTAEANGRPSVGMILTAFTARQIGLWE